MLIHDSGLPGRAFANNRKNERSGGQISKLGLHNSKFNAESSQKAQAAPYQIMRLMAAFEMPRDCMHIT